jgi:RNA polymerase sigma-70 factor, ECF subfamily
MDDDSLLLAVAAGDESALRTLFERHAPWVAARLRRAMPVDAVEDVLQESFLAVWRVAASYGGRGEVGAWIWGIARRQAALRQRLQGRGDHNLSLDELLERQDPDDPAATAVGRADLEQAIATLGPADGARRELVRLFLIEDRPLAEVAEALNIPVGTVKSRIFAVRHQLRLVLEGAR